MGRSQGIKPEPHRVCAYCQFSDNPCPKCRTKLGISPEWAAKYLGFTDWKGTAPASKRDREWLLNAAIKAHKEDARKKCQLITGEGLWFLDRAKKELLDG